MLSAIDVTLGAYGDVGRDELWGEPKPDIPDTLYLFVEGVAIVGRVGGIRGEPLLIKECRLEAEPGGGVEPYVEFKVEEDLFVVETGPFVPLEPPLLDSVDDLKLALDRLRSLPNIPGAIVDCS